MLLAHNTAHVLPHSLQSLDVKISRIDRRITNWAIIKIVDLNHILIEDWLKIGEGVIKNIVLLMPARL